MLLVTGLLVFMLPEWYPCVCQPCTVTTIHAQVRCWFLPRLSQACGDPFSVCLLQYHLLAGPSTTTTCRGWHLHSRAGLPTTHFPV